MRIKWLILSGFLVMASIGHADLVPTGYQQIARLYQIPASVLYAVALTESGKTIQTGIFRPWPWTLNVAGQPKRFKTFQAACAEIQHQLRHGVRSIDIGLMQLNWRWHRQRLKQPCQALQPYTNLHHGAALLKAAFATKHSWLDAAGYYHSPGLKPRQRLRAKAYAQRVLRHQARLETS